MSELLGGLYSISDRLKRRVKDFARSPRSYLEQVAGQMRDQAGRPSSARNVARRLEASPEEIQAVMDWWNPSGPYAALAGVVKQKGGNWLSGSVEDALRGLKRDEVETPLHAMSDEVIARNAGLNRWIEGPLTKYIKTRMASPEDEVRLLAERRPLELKQALESGLAAAAKEKARAEAIRQAGPKPGMPPGAWEGAIANAENKAERLAREAQDAYDFGMQHVLHFEPTQDAVMRRTARAVANRERGNISQGGTQSTRLGQSPLAQAWETLSDSEVTPGTYRSLMPSAMRKDHPDNLRDIGGEFAVANPDASAYMFGNWADTGANRVLGFPHLIDELSNALNPASGLPRHLQLTPEAVKNMSMEKAVRLVADINAFRAAQKVEANRKLAEKAFVVRGYEHPRDALTKQFMEQGMDANSARVAAELELSNNTAKYAAQRALAENNPKGLRWVEIRKPDVEGKVKTTNAEQGLAEVVPEDMWDDWIAEGERLARQRGLRDEDEIYDFALAHATARDEALGGQGAGMYAAADDANVIEVAAAEKALREQLKYEGDIMQHCVGGYCEDILEGRSRIFSLRDAKGEPHVTIEVDPGRKLSEADLPDDVRDMLAEKYGDATREEFEAAVQKAVADRAVPQRIVQIKGKQNQAPKEEYLPFVQDFVRNSPLGSPWSDVGDLANTGLIRETTHPSGFVTEAERREMLRNLIEDNQRLIDAPRPEFASGGLVDQPRRAASWDILAQ